MTKIVEKLPVKTRLPVEAWALAGIVTLFSLVCSLAHIPLTHHTTPSVEQANEYAKPSHRARV
jgi:hypothetical protein